MDKFSLIDVNSSNSSKMNELFHLMQVEEKYVAEKNIPDSPGTHVMLKGKPYLKCKWFSFLNEGNRFVSFTPQSEETEKSLVYVGEIFSTQLRLNDRNQMDITDYRMLVCQVMY